MACKAWISGSERQRFLRDGKQTPSFLLQQNSQGAAQAERTQVTLSRHRC